MITTLITIFCILLIVVTTLNLFNLIPTIVASTLCALLAAVHLYSGEYIWFIIFTLFAILNYGEYKTEKK